MQVDFIGSEACQRFNMRTYETEEDGKVLAINIIIHDLKPLKHDDDDNVIPYNGPNPFVFDMEEFIDDICSDYKCCLGKIDISNINKLRLWIGDHMSCKLDQLFDFILRIKNTSMFNEIIQLNQNLEFEIMGNCCGPTIFIDNTVNNDDRMNMLSSFIEDCKDYIKSRKSVRSLNGVIQQ